MFQKLNLVVSFPFIFPNISCEVTCPLCLFPQLEARVSDLSREKNDLESRIEEDQDEIEELLDKQRSHISQISSVQSQITDATLQVTELQEVKQTLEGKVCKINWGDRAYAIWFICNSDV